MWCADPWIITRCVAISCTVTHQFSFTMASTAAMASSVSTQCAWPGRGETVRDLTPFRNILVHSHACCSDRHVSPYWSFIHRWISMGFNPSLLKKRMTESCSSLVHISRGLPNLHYCCAVVLCSCIVLPMSAPLQTMSNTVANLQDNRNVFWIFIALVRFSFNSPS
jgi:hypothetical protein